LWSVARLHQRPERAQSVVAKLLGDLKQRFFSTVILPELFAHGHGGFEAFAVRIDARNLHAARRSRPSDIRSG